MKFNKGDMVRVIHNGAIYTTYDDFGHLYIGWENGRSPKRKTKYRVVGQHEHEDDGSPIYAIENASGQVYLYAEEGLELLPEKKVLSSSSEPFKHPSWLLVYQDGDRTPDGGIWGGTTILDNETQWYCFRIPMDNTKMTDIKEGHHGGIRFVNQQGKTNKIPLDPVRAAAMLLAFSEEEKE